MNTIRMFDQACLHASRGITRTYSTSFSFAVRSLHRRFRDPIHAIYGFVRFADEIVDTFHEHDKRTLLERFRTNTHLAIEEGISLDPVLHSFQHVANTYGIGPELWRTFLDSMAMDLTDAQHDRASYDRYITGSAEAVGLMCLRVFCEGDKVLFDRLKPAAMRLGAAFQKVNFLRDMKDDHQQLGRTYFPGVNAARLSPTEKHAIEREIQADLDAAITGIRDLPNGARLGVYVAYVYYKALFQKIRALPMERIMLERIRVNDPSKMMLFTTSFVRYQFGMI